LLPAGFEYQRPHTLDEALKLLEQLGDDAKVLAGGMSLIPLMKLRFATPAHLVDLGDLEELQGVSEGDGRLRIGAMVPHGELERSGLLKDRYHAMAAAAPLISDPLVRNRGTIGGSLAHADPAGDWGSVMIAMDASVMARSTSGEREIAIDDLLVDTFTSSLAANEILTEVHVPTPTAASGGSYLKLERKVGDFATVGVAVHVELADGKIGKAGIALTAVGPRNTRAKDAEQSLVGAEPTEETFAEAGRLAAEVARPNEDLRGSVAYKRNVVDVFVRRGLARAVESARAGGSH
jgi:aerobic carbon-monoxide dehydrogenase medium subunit